MNCLDLPFRLIVIHVNHIDLASPALLVDSSYVTNRVHTLVSGVYFFLGLGTNRVGRMVWATVGLAKTRSILTSMQESGRRSVCVVHKLD